MIDNWKASKSRFGKVGGYGGILQYCQNIKYISIDVAHPVTQSLIDLDLDYYNKIEQFHGENHPQLKVVNCQKGHVNFMRSVVLSVQNLEYLKLALRYINDIDIIYDDLKGNM